MSRAGKQNSGSLWGELGWKQFLKKINNNNNNNNNNLFQPRREGGREGCGAASGLQREEQRLGAAPRGRDPRDPRAGGGGGAGPGPFGPDGAVLRVPGPGVPGGSTMGRELKPGSSPSQGRENHPGLPRVCGGSGGSGADRSRRKPEVVGK